MDRHKGKHYKWRIKILVLHSEEKKLYNVIMNYRVYKPCVNALVKRAKMANIAEISRNVNIFGSDKKYFNI